MAANCARLGVPTPLAPKMLEHPRLRPFASLGFFWFLIRVGHRLLAGAGGFRLLEFVQKPFRIVRQDRHEPVAGRLQKGSHTGGFNPPGLGLRGHEPSGAFVLPSELCGDYDAAGVTAFLSRARTAAVAVCAKIELEIGQLDAADAAAFLADLGLSESGLDRVIRASYDLLGYISFFTVGEDECRAWSIPRHTPAQLAAGEIHSDIARGFIRAEVVSYDALLGRGSMAACRDHGELRLEGKEYVVQDGDIINFRFAT